MTLSLKKLEHAKYSKSEKQIKISFYYPFHFKEIFIPSSIMITYYFCEYQIFFYFNPSAYLTYLNDDILKVEAGAPDTLGLYIPYDSIIFKSFNSLYFNLINNEY